MPPPALPGGRSPSAGARETLVTTRSTSLVTVELYPGDGAIVRLDDGRVLVVVSTVMEPQTARRMGRNLQLLGATDTPDQTRAAGEDA